jgi:Tfp pilus assembly protein PilN
MSRFDLHDSTQDPALEQIRRVRRTVILQITALALAALALPFYLIFTQLRGEAAQLASDLATVEARIAALSAPAPEVEALTAQAAAILTLTAALEAARPPAGVNWPAVITAIDGYDRGQIELTALTQTDNQLLLEGRAVDNAAVVAYVQQLAASPYLADVEVQSIKLTGAAARAADGRADGTATTWTVSAPAQKAEPAATPVVSPTPDPRPAQFVLVLVVRL